MPANTDEQQPEEANPDGRKPKEEGLLGALKHLIAFSQIIRKKWKEVSLLLALTIAFLALSSGSAVVLVVP